jgi:hypothetical protein
MKRTVITSLLIFSSSFPFACSSETLDIGSATNATSTGKHYACDNRSIESTCADFPDGTSQAVAERYCDGIIIETPCPLERAVGICAAPSQSKDVPGEATNTYYSDGPEPRTEATAREACASFPGSTFRTP